MTFAKLHAIIGTRDLLCNYLTHERRAALALYRAHAPVTDIMRAMGLNPKHWRSEELNRIRKKLERP